MCSTERSRWFAAVGFPIRISSDHSLYTAPRGFSQCPTSFFGIWRLGIHHKPFVASLRDAEISILLSSSSFYVCSTLYSFIKVPTSPSPALASSTAVSIAALSTRSRCTGKLPIARITGPKTGVNISALPMLRNARG